MFKCNYSSLFTSVSQELNKQANAENVSYGRALCQLVPYWSAVSVCMTSLIKLNHGIVELDMKPHRLEDVEAYCLYQCSCAV